jgi:hypothetical protein
MGLVNTREFQTIGIIVGAVFVIGVIYFFKLLKDKSARTTGGRRKRLRQIRKKRR